MFFYPIDYRFFLIFIPVILFSFYASYKVNSAFKKYQNIRSASNWTASDMSRMLLEKNGCAGVKVERTRGSLTDNYNPRKLSVNLSEPVYNSSSIAALGVAAHEVGHAVQHSTGYVPLKLRTVLVPAINVGTIAAIPLLLIGVVLELLFQSGLLGSFGTVLVYIGVFGYSLATIFTLITLPVEFNASRRALAMLSSTGVLSSSETKQAGKVLNAAALTYVAAFTVSLMYLLRLLLILSSVRNRK